jgi:subtilisin-like proprotein convertase family protein
MGFRRVVWVIGAGIVVAACSLTAGGAEFPRIGPLDAASIAAAERDQLCKLSPGEMAVLGTRDGLAASQVAESKGITGKTVAGGDRFVIVKMGRGANGDDFDDPAIAPVFRAGTGPDAPFLFPNGEVITLFAPETSAAQAIERVTPCGLAFVRLLEIRGAFLFRAASPAKSLASAAAASAAEGVLFSAPNWVRQRSPRQEDPLYACQWHLNNTGQFKGAVAGNDIDVESVWPTYRGSAAQIVCVVDDGLEIAQKDLEPNVVPGLSWDFVHDAADPTGGKHGTAVGGVAAARGFNGMGGRGVAPEAGLCGYVILGDGGVEDADEAEAETRAYDRIGIYNNSWGPTDDGQRLEGPRPLTAAAMAQGVTGGRGGKGVLYTWAGGNGHTFADNSNYDGYANWRYTIAVGASTSAGKRSFYSENGANLCVNASSNGGADPGVTTTDRTGPLGYNRGTQPRDFADPDFTDTFGGTSSATPAVSGVCALLLQANPDLGWRDVKTILMTTAVQNDPEDPDWAANGAGHLVSHKYGFGRVDASAAVIAASAWTNLPPEVRAEGSASPGLPVPLGPGGVRSTVSLTRNLRVESAEVTFTALTADRHWGDLQVLLVSPSGTWSVLAEKHDTSKSASRYENWRFGSARYLDELSAGDWTLVVKDLGTTGGATFAAWSLAVYGTEADVGEALRTASPPTDGRGAQAAVTFQASPASGGTTEPGATATVPAGSSLPILAVSAYEYQYETSNGEPVYVPCTFTGWTARPPENVAFADADRDITTAVFSGDATVTANFRAPDRRLSPGAGLKVAAADLGLETFSRRPIVYGTLGSKRIAMTVYGDFPSQTLVAGWPAGPKIYDPGEYKNPPQSLGALLEQEPMPGVALDGLIVQAEGGSATLDLAQSRSFLLAPPDVAGASGELTEGSELLINGSFFGTGVPRIFVEYVRGGKYLTRECVPAGDFVFEDLAGKPSCMDPWSGESALAMTCPKAPPGAVPTGYIVVKNAMGMGAYFLPARRPACE